MGNYNKKLISISLINFHFMMGDAQKRKKWERRICCDRVVIIISI